MVAVRRARRVVRESCILGGGRLVGWLVNWKVC